MIAGNIGTGLLFLGLVLSLRDIYANSEKKPTEKTNFEDEEFVMEFGDEKTKSTDLPDEEELPVRKPTAQFTAPHTIKNLPDMQFLFCVSCGYRQAYDEFSKYVHEKYPTIKIEGHNYPPFFWKATAAQVLTFVKITLIVWILMGLNPFPSLNLGTPRIVTWALNNKLSSCLMVFLLSNSCENALLATGAFEIYIGGERIWSKLESGRVPTPTELLQIIDQYMELQGAKVPFIQLHQSFIA
uniref:SelT-like protein n=1 Tax=Syphacia muris TaxID=451379 RepID=A0A0N5APK5_9BILA